MLTYRKTTLLLAVTFVTAIFLTIARAEPATTVRPDTRCPVCGMFVAKYTSWLAQILHADGTRHTFDGVKDMMAYYFTPGKYGTLTQDSIKEIWVKDYYNLTWIDARKAYFVVGSNIYGPMGNEFIPFSSKDAANSFLKDHKGRQTFAFGEIDKTLVESLRSGSTMKH